MAGKYGVEEAKKVAQALANLVNIGTSLLHKNYLSLFGLLGPFNVISSLNLQELKNEILELDSDERLSVEQAFDNALNLDDKALQQKIIDSVDALNSALDLASSALKTIDDLKSLVLRFKSILGV